MHFITHKGIVLTKVSDIYLLVATREAWDDCPQIKLITPTQAAFWGFIENGLDEEEILDEIEHIEKKELLLRIYNSFIKRMKESGYIIGEED